MTERHITVLVPWYRQSTRCPSKNKALWPYTRDWLTRELEHMPDNWWVDVLVLGAKGNSELYEDVPPLNWTYALYSQREDLQPLAGLLDAAYDNHDLHRCDALVLAQLTQPVRRKGLLRDCVDELLASEDPSKVLVRTCTYWSREEWRAEYPAAQQEDVQAYHYDGALYAWAGRPTWVGNTDDNRLAAWVHNYTGPVVDVDYKWQWCPEYIAGVQALADRNWEEDSRS